MSDDEVARLDSERLRCLAHPLRIRLLGALRLDGPATSATLARRLDTNTGATSYHLRKLAEVGLVEELEHRGTARERWWRAAHTFTSYSVTDFEHDPTDRAAAEWIEGQHQRVVSQWRNEWQATRDDYPRDWREVAGTSDFLLELTPEQVRRLNDDIIELLQSYRDARPSAADDVHQVLVLIDTFPVKDLAL